MLKFIKSALFCLIIYAFASNSSIYRNINATDTSNNNIHNKIKVKVTDKIITEYDFKTRMQTTSVLNNINFQALNPEDRKLFEDQILESLIDDQIAELEAERIGIAVDEAVVNEFIADLAKANNMTPPSFLNKLKDSGVNIKSFKQQIKSRIIWSHFVKSYLKHKVNISEMEINASQNLIPKLKAERMKINNTAKPSINDTVEIAEIVLPMNYNKDNMDIQGLVQHISNELAKGTPFSYLASQYSIDETTAQNGGLIPKLKLKTMDEIYIDTITKLQNGQVGDPIQVGDNVIIIQLLNFDHQKTQETKTKTNYKNITNEDVKNALFDSKIEMYLSNHIARMKKQYFIQIISG